jgi:hypothetical protein
LTATCKYGKIHEIMAEYEAVFEQFGKCYSGGSK